MWKERDKQNMISFKAQVCTDEAIAKVSNPSNSCQMVGAGKRANVAKSQDNLRPGIRTGPSGPTLTTLSKVTQGGAFLEVCRFGLVWCQTLFSLRCIHRIKHRRQISQIVSIILVIDCKPLYIKTII